MSDDEFDEDEDLPPITVVSSVSRQSSWSMPSAGELAEQRQREWRAEEELRALRSQGPAGEVSGAAVLSAAGRSDSSGSEGDAALLAAAVGALRLPSAPVSAATGPGLARRLLAAMAGADPAPIEAAYLAALGGPARDLKAVTDTILLGVGSSEEPAQWPAWERASVSRVLCAAAWALAGPRARRALHHVLDGCPAAELARLARAAASATVGNGSGGLEALLGLADAARGGGRGGELLAALLLRHALLALVEGETGISAAGEERALTPAEVARLLGLSARREAGARLAALRLGGRALAAGGARGLPPGAQGAKGAKGAKGGAAKGRDPQQQRLAMAAARLQLLFP